MSSDGAISVGECIFVWILSESSAFDRTHLPSGVGLLLQDAAGPTPSSFVSAKYSEALVSHYKRGVESWQKADALAIQIQQEGHSAAGAKVQTAIDAYTLAVDAFKAADPPKAFLNAALTATQYPLLVLTLVGADLATLSHRSYRSGFLTFCLRCLKMDDKSMADSHVICPKAIALQLMPFTAKKLAQIRKDWRDKNVNSDDVRQTLEKFAVYAATGEPASVYDGDCNLLCRTCDSSSARAEEDLAKWWQQLRDHHVLALASMHQQGPSNLQQSCSQIPSSPASFYTVAVVHLYRVLACCGAIGSGRRMQSLIALRAVLPNLLSGDYSNSDLPKIYAWVPDFTQQPQQNGEPVNAAMYFPMGAQLTAANGSKTIDVMLASLGLVHLAMGLGDDVPPGAPWAGFSQIIPGQAWVGSSCKPDSAYLTVVQRQAMKMKAHMDGDPDYTARINTTVGNRLKAEQELLASGAPLFLFAKIIFDWDHPAEDSSKDTMTD